LGGKLVIGTTSVSTFALDIVGESRVKGNGGSNVFFVQSNAGSNLFYVQNSGTIGFTALTWVPESTVSAVILSASASRSWNVSGDKTNTSGTGCAFFVTSGFTPTSGTGLYNAQTINPTINQTGGANGITRGLYVNPTLTSAADWRSIEWSNNSGWGLYGAGTANNYLGGNLTINRGQNGLTGINIVNITSGASSGAQCVLETNGGVANYGKYSTTTTAYKILTASSAFLFNGTAGDIAILNDFATGTIKFAAGASSTAQMTLTAAGRLLLGTTTESTFLLDVNGTARVSGAVTFGNLINISVGVNSGLRYDSSNYFYVDAASGFVLNSWDYTIINNVSGTGYGGMLIRSGTTGAKQASAHLQIDSTTKGFLPPRGTNTQMLAIASPATGLMFYDTTNNKLNCYDGTTWQACW
jgi:hypothetical protein